MHLYLVRHAHALSAPEDARRPLSPKGRRITQQVAAMFKATEALGTVHSVWHSPLVRARETAELLARGLGLKAALVETEGLLSEDDPAPIADRLDRTDEVVLIVGHEPQLSALATLLVRGKDSPPAFDLRKSAIIALERTVGRHKRTRRARWIVRWHFSPELLPPAPVRKTAPS